MDDINVKKSNFYPDSFGENQISLQPNQLNDQRKSSEFYEEIHDFMVDNYDNYERPISQPNEKYVELYKPNDDLKKNVKPKWTRKKVPILITIIVLILIALTVAVVLIVLATASNTYFILNVF